MKTNTFEILDLFIEIIEEKTGKKIERNKDEIAITDIKPIERVSEDINIEDIKNAVILDEKYIENKQYEARKPIFCVSKKGKPFIREIPLEEKSPKRKLLKTNFGMINAMNRGKSLDEIHKILKEKLTGRTAEEVAKELFNTDLQIPKTKEEIEREEKRKLAEEIYELSGGNRRLANILLSALKIDEKI